MTGVSPLARAYDLSQPSSGDGRAPAIVFAHGTRLTRAMWTPQVAQLGDEFRVLTLDLPGHGTMADELFTMAGAADHVAAVIREAIGGPAVVVGLSLGGYVAMATAERHPSLVRGLVLSGATAEPNGPRAVPYRTLAWAMTRFDGPRLDALNAWFFRSRFEPTVSEPIVTAGFWSRGGATALRAVAGERFTPRLAGYDGPTLIINGEYDLPFRLSAARFARSARHVQRVRIRGATHLANLDRPAAFSTAVRRFVRSLDEAR
ncbi:MAG TPA: alpha/beta hydrolase [Candidatus Saccharimonadales bacterium]|nr:alpha/beta hydrolase [Candidatus Saccharimonadales bacterium]